MSGIADNTIVCKTYERTGGRGKKRPTKNCGAPGKKRKFRNQICRNEYKPEWRDLNEISEAIQDPEYISFAIDCIADKIASAWMREKYARKG